MSGAAFPRGSEWRKWDLQVHTPFSELNNGFGSDFDEFAKVFFNTAVAESVSAVGVTDYFSIRGYTELRRLQKDHTALTTLLGQEVAEKAASILLLPNIEFRTSILVQSPHSPAARVNYHVLFSEDVPPEVIDEHFLRDLKFTSESSPDTPDNRHSLTLQNLAELGARLKAEHAKFRNRSDLFVGMMQAVVSPEVIDEVLQRQTARFKDRYVIVVPADEDLSQVSWDGQGHAMRKQFLQRAHFIFSSNPSTRAFGLGLKHPSVDAFVREFKSLKACIHGSDAHSTDGLFKPAEDRQLWLKADPTFQGLRQLIFEPESRVFIGERPPELVRAEELRATKIMTDVELIRSSTAKEKWFSGHLPLNDGLVAIIGNKGCGKSALADILALLGDSQIGEHFSFLNAERFLQPRDKRGQHFSALVRWRSGRERTKRLGEQSDPNGTELVKYIPQSYLEGICSELVDTSESAFYRELMDVIFSHVPEAERLGKHSLPELIAFVTEVQEQKIDLQLEELAAANRSIAELERMSTAEFKQALQLQLAQKSEELSAHEKAKPAPVQKPEEDESALALQARVGEQLQAAQDRLREVDGELVSINEALAKGLRQVAAADRLLNRMTNLEGHFATFQKESESDASELETPIATLAQLVVARPPIQRRREEASALVSNARAALDVDLEGSTAQRRQNCQRELDAILATLDAPARRYEEYKQRLAEWETRQSELEGASDVPTSLRGLNARIAEIGTLPTRIDAEKERRQAIVDEILQAKEELLKDYRRLYKSVQDFIDAHPVSRGSGHLRFSAHLAIEGFPEAFLGFMHQGRKGSFQGDEQGRERVLSLVRGADLTTRKGVQAFLRSVQSHLESDRREKRPKRLEVGTQLRQGHTVEELYDFLYGLTYLKPRFELRWMGKPLDQLSPGERGTLLLVFYLLIDRREDPLIIDQPEENLDNQTVATTLVPAVRYAKTRRQVVIVTHNPNLAVVCDADQVIHATIDKADGNRVTYVSGSIENPDITRRIVDVLEGTKPLFDKRDERYEVLERLGR